MGRFEAAHPRQFDTLHFAMKLSVLSELYRYRFTCRRCDAHCDFQSSCYTRASYSSQMKSSYERGPDRSTPPPGGELRYFRRRAHVTWRVPRSSTPLIDHDYRNGLTAPCIRDAACRRGTVLLIYTQLARTLSAIDADPTPGFYAYYIYAYIYIYIYRLIHANYVGGIASERVHATYSFKSDS